MKMKLWHLPYALARMLPYKLRYYVVVNAGCDATTGEWGHIETPSVTIFDILKRMK
jgi:hypothetical protein